jgi:hypothetical protein
MNPEDLVRQLAERARLETPPRVDVANRVMARLRGGREEAATGWIPLGWVTALAVAVTIPVALLALAAWETWTDPLAAMSIEIVWRAL